MLKKTVILVLISCFSSHVFALSPIISAYEKVHPVIAKHGMVASQEALATQVGVDILKQGGNAIDAAVAVGFALAVTLPRAGNLGGGGFMMVHLASSGETLALDYREKAPAASKKTMFLDNLGKVDTTKSQRSILSSGVPGTVYGLSHALEHWGTMTLEQVMAPAIALAENGIKVSQDLSDSLALSYTRMKTYPASLSAYFKKNGASYQTGETLKQRDLAKSLKLISKNGPSSFYEGEIASKIINYMNKMEGIMTAEDLKAYRPVVREPIIVKYKNVDVYSMPPPSSGGIHLAQLLTLVEQMDLKQLGHLSANYIHLLTEAMKLVYADRSKYLGDPDYYDIPQEDLLSERYLEQRRDSINPQKATPSNKIFPGNINWRYESNETTHYSIVDQWGNAVSNTYTLNFSYGNGQVVPGTGILLNNEMDDFSSLPGVPNAYGLIGGKLNSVEPHKRMLSSMTPTIVLKQGKPFIVTGSPGGSRIITTVFQILMNILEFDMNVAEATYASRFHHQWLPDELRLEVGFSPDTLALLENKGHSLSIKSAMGSTQTIMVKRGLFFGASDTRKSGSLCLGY